MLNSAFEHYVLGGGWAMFVLVPASVVGVATVVRALLGGGGLGDETGAGGAGVVRPLLWIYVVAPLVGAAGAATRLMGDAGGVADVLLPLNWGIGLGLVAVLFYFFLGVWSGERAVSRWLVGLPGVIGLAVAAAISGAAGESGGGGERGAGSDRPTLSLSSLHGGDGRSGVDTPVVEVDGGVYSIDGRRVEGSDVLFRLSGVAGRSDSIIVRVGADQPAVVLKDALALVNQAGFVHVGIETEE